MKHNKLSEKVAKCKFEQIIAISSSSISLYDRLVFQDANDPQKPTSLRIILMSVIHDWRKENRVIIPKAKVWDFLVYILDNSPVHFGDTLSEDIKSVYSALNNYLKNGYSDIEIKDFQKILKTISEFIAVLSGLTVPDNLVILYTDEAAISEGPNDTSKITEKDIFANPTPRVPVVLCLDVSSSMTMDDRIGQLNQGVQEFFSSIKNDSVAKWAAEICIVTFNNEAQKVVDFDYVDKQSEAFSNVKLVADGNTSMGAAVELSLELLDKRKEQYRKSGIDYWQPWLVLMTDGQATDNIDIAAEKCAKLVNDGKLVLFPLAIGRGANMNQLKRFSPKRVPLHLNANKISEFFNWLSQSVRTTSQSTIGTEVKLPDISSWSVL